MGVLAACDLALGGWEAADLEDPRRRKPVTPLAEPAGEKMRKEKTHKPYLSISIFGLASGAETKCGLQPHGLQK